MMITILVAFGALALATWVGALLGQSDLAGGRAVRRAPCPSRQVPFALPAGRSRLS
jgi:hypothetical protein